MIHIGNNEAIDTLHVGLNWGVKDKQGQSTSDTSDTLDLNIGCLILHENNKLEYVHHGDPQQRILDFEFVATPDDKAGDLRGNDRLDNEIISIRTKKVNPNTQIVFFVENRNPGPIGSVNHFEFRLYTGQPNHPEKEFLKIDINEKAYIHDSCGIILGKISFWNNEIHFNPYEIPVAFEGIENVKEAAAKTVDFI